MGGVGHFSLHDSFVSPSLEQDFFLWLTLFFLFPRREKIRENVLFLPSTCVSFGHPHAWTCIDLRRWRLAWTCIHFGRAQLACVAWSQDEGEGREGEGGLERARGLINYIFQIKNVSGLIYIQVSL